jgi:hypothetical protein
MTRSHFLTPPQVAARFKISVEKVHAWIRSGQLCASNLATKSSGRPRYAIDERDLERFIASRAVVPRTKISRRSRKPPKRDVVQFF